MQFDSQSNLVNDQDDSGITLNLGKVIDVVYQQYDELSEQSEQSEKLEEAENISNEGGPPLIILATDQQCQEKSLDNSPK